jgi:hypothetical protein
MPVYRTGIANSTRGATAVSSTPDLQGQINNLKSQLVAARVIDIVLDENHPKFKDVGEWNGIGAIYYEFTNQSATGTTVNFALPYDSQIKTYPLINELVLLFSLPNQQQGQNTSNQSYFYLKPLGIWNHPHHDAYPNPSTIVNPSQRRDYKSTENGSVRRVEDQSTEIDLNSPVNPSQNTFVEKTDIHPLMPYMGDSLLEGRHGQSLRFGSTAKSKSSINNNWSSAGTNGDPITIVRNGQPTNVSDKGWIPITEDITNDLSSIYLTSYQKIPFSIANENFVSYTTKPILPSQFTNPQIILNSDRIVLNAKTDSVLISGQNSVGISSNNSVNIEAKQIYLDGNDIRLGNKNASQSALKGDITVEYLKILITELKNLTEVLKTVQDWPGGVPTPNSAILTVANSSQEIFEKIYNNIDNIKSNFIKLK